MKKGYFESMIDSHIVTIDETKKVFFKHGTFGCRGYIIPNESVEIALRKKIKRFHIGILIGSGVLGGFGSHVVASMDTLGFVIFLISVSFCAWVYTKLFFRNITRNLELTNVKIKNSPLKRWMEMGQNMSSLLLFGSTFITVLFTIGPLWLYTIDKDPKMLVSGCVFALLLVPYIIAIKNKIKSKS